MTVIIHIIINIACVSLGFIGGALWWDERGKK